FWCRRRDSNSHSFRHYPLKIACLPISPRRRLICCPGSHEAPCGFRSPGSLLVYSEITLHSGAGRRPFIRAHLVGICAAPDAAGAGGTAVAGAALDFCAGAALPGICVATPDAGTCDAGAVTAARSSTLPLLAGRKSP